MYVGIMWKSLPAVSMSQDGEEDGCQSGKKKKNFWKYY